MTTYYVPGTTTKVARTHHFLAVDGVTIGASGHPDPKRVEVDGVTYKQLAGSGELAELAKDPSKRFVYRSFRHRVYCFWRKYPGCWLYWLFGRT